MIAAVLEKLSEPLEFHELIVPDLNYGQVLVELKYSGICGRQIQEIFGFKGEDKFLPHLLGHEGSGIIKKIGPGVSKCNIGDHVVLHWRESRGIQAEFPKYKSKTKKHMVIGGGLVTTFNSEAVISENRLTVIPKDASFKTAALLGCALTTALGLVNNEANIKIGQSVIIIGAGSVGQSLVKACSMVSAHPIISVDIDDSKLNFSKELGAVYSININKENYTEQIKKILGSKGADVIIDTVGNTKIINESYFLCAEEGKLILVGQPRYNEDLTFKNISRGFKGINIFDSLGGKTNPDKDIFRYLKLEESKKYNFEKLVSDIFKINDINKAIELVKNNKIKSKALIKF
jgi:S-(hydroxymethyl)glutathione dehydrogenase/alcohol dehydrogenase